MELAVTKGFLDADKAREILFRLGQAEKNQARLSVDRLMIMEEILAREQVAEIQEAQKRKIIFCICGQKTNIFQFEPGTRVRCKSCGRAIEIPKPGDSENGI